jgi:hypothetical protein
VLCGILFVLYTAIPWWFTFALTEQGQVTDRYTKAIE